MDQPQFETIFDFINLRATLQVMDFHEVAQRVLDLAEGDMPGCAWLDIKGIVHYAETMSEVEGLVLCMATRLATDESEEPFWIATWLVQIGLDDHSAKLARAFKTILA